MTFGCRKNPSINGKEIVFATDHGQETWTDMDGHGRRRNTE